jgi:MFS family permease
MEVKDVKDEKDSHESKDYFSDVNKNDNEIQESESDPSWKDSLHSLRSSQNYTVFLLTAWVFNSITAIWYFFNLYLRALQWDYLLIGLVLTIVSLISTACRLVGGYLGDLWDRKKLSILAMLIAALYHLIIGLYTGFILVLIGLIIFGLLDIVKSGSSAYLLENIPKKDSGFGISLFTAGRTFGLIVLLIFGIIIPIIGFQDGFRSVLIVGGVLLLSCTVARAKLLQPSPKSKRIRESSIVKDFFSENWRAVKIILGLAPLILAVVAIDSISDSMFRFGALIYTNEFLGVDILGINIILICNLIITLPLLLAVGRFADKKGTRKAAIIVYSLMPLAAIILLIAPLFPFWAPTSWVNGADSLYYGLGVVFSTPFLGLILKYINDTLWGLVLVTLVRRKLPLEDSSKFLAVFWFIVYTFKSFGPLVAGFVMTYLGPTILFVFLLILNLFILAVLGKGDISE